MSRTATLACSVLLFLLSGGCTPRPPETASGARRSCPPRDERPVSTWHRARSFGSWQAAETQSFGEVWLPPDVDAADDFDGTIWRAGKRIVGIDLRVARGRRALAGIGASVGIVVDDVSLRDPAVRATLGDLARRVHVGITLPAGGRGRAALERLGNIPAAHLALVGSDDNGRQTPVLEYLGVSVSGPASRLTIGPSVQGFEGSHSTDLRRAEDLRSLRLVTNRNDEAIVALLRAQPRLERLRLELLAPAAGLRAQEDLAKAILGHARLRDVELAGHLTLSFLRGLAPSCQVRSVEAPRLALDLPTARALSRLAGLRHLEVGPVVTDALAPLERIKQLERLTLTIGASQLSRIQSFAGPELRLTVNPGAEPNSANLERLAALSNLSELHVIEGALTASRRRPLLGNALRILHISARGLAGVHLPRSVRELTVAGRVPAPLLVEQLEHLPKLRRLTVVDASSLDDEGYASLKQLRQLRVLRLHQAHDAVFRQLGQMDGLIELSLSGPGITDAGLKQFPPRMMNLAALDLTGTAVTTEGVASLPALPELRALILDRTSIDGSLLAVLPDRFPQLAMVSLEGVALGVHELAPLSRLRHLSALYIDATAMPPRELRSFWCSSGQPQVSTFPDPDSPGQVPWTCETSADSGASIGQ